MRKILVIKTESMTICALQIKDKSFNNNMIQGPLAGISCAPFRVLTTRYGQPAFCYTEMISCKTLINKPGFAERRYVEKHPDEGAVCYQLSGNDPQALAQAVKIVTDYGADLIDLNCGCPVKKIRDKGAGSRLLTQPALLFQLITAMKSNTHLPVSIKIRVQGDSDEKFNQEIAQVITDAGADFVTVHGRHWTEHYETACRYDDIQFFVEALPMPVIGNGDISNLDTLKRMFATGCAAVMIGRAGVGQPWLCSKLMAEMQGHVFQLPKSEEIGQLFLKHVSDLWELLGIEKLAILQARKFGKYYARDLTERKAFTTDINLCQDFKTLQQITLEYFN